MAWDTEGTKRRIHEAALAEFAEHGLHGTTIDRIAKSAQVNRERVYNYFGGKEKLFSAVIRSELDQVATAVPLAVASAEDVGEFAGRSFDYQLAHPDLARLLLWEGLAGKGTVAEESTRAELYISKTTSIAAAQKEGLIDNSVEAAHLVFLVLSLASYWAAAPQIARMLCGRDANDPAERAARRAAVVDAATQIARPRLAHVSPTAS
ncbi:TetR family transcriptional regulator [Streptomyces sp. NPDC002814]